MTDSVKYITVAGPTASGKSSLALKLAQNFQGEIINCDSVQVYRDFNIGSAKPSVEEQKLVPHHLFDLVTGNDGYDAAVYARQGRAVIEEVASRGKLPIVVGGTGLYLRALWGDSFHSLPKDENLRIELAKIKNESLYEELKFIDPKRASEIHLNDRFRLLRAVELIRLLKGPISSQNPSDSKEDESFKIKMQLDRPLLHKRIAQRSEEMLKEGLVAEVKGLISQGIDQNAKPMQSIGYKQVCEFLDGDLSEGQLLERIIIATRQYAKRQETWFKKVSFDHYSDRRDYELISEKVRNYLMS